MIAYSRYELANGLRLLVHEDRSTPLIAVNIAYNVGSRFDPPSHTGFAHLFEHLMFGGSASADSFDDPLQEAGGDSNAFTNNDITNYYEVLPAENVDTALWLEADRLHRLTLNQKALNVQRKVVVEEFKETCLNQPYGDVWHHLSAMCYQHHPYRWPVIGLEPKHIKDATLEVVSEFFKTYYNPANAVLVLAGNLSGEEGLALAEKWFGPIPGGQRANPSLSVEPPQTAKRFQRVEAEVPVNALYMAFHMPGRNTPEYYTCDLLTDLLAYGKSSRLYYRFVKSEKLFTEVDAYVTGTTDPGLIVVEGRIAPGVSYERAEAAIWDELHRLRSERLPDSELEKLKNRAESNLEFGESGTLSKAMNLAYYEILGHAELINREAEYYQLQTADSLREMALQVFREENCSVLYYGKGT
jgi:zinc protease